MLIPKAFTARAEDSGLSIYELNLGSGGSSSDAQVIILYFYVEPVHIIAILKIQT